MNPHRPSQHPDDYDFEGNPISRSTLPVVWIVLSVLGIVGILGMGFVALALVGGMFWLTPVGPPPVPPTASVSPIPAGRAASSDAVVTEVAEGGGGPALPLPPPDPPRQPPAVALPLDKEGDPARWVVLFRSDNPDHWNRDVKGDAFAIPVEYAPQGTRYLRLRRMDTGDIQILPLQRSFLLAGGPGEPGAAVWWNGTNTGEEGTGHLGIAQAPGRQQQARNNLVLVQTRGADGFTGSGFGHTENGAARGRGYAWRGIGTYKMVFEIAVTAGPLTETESRCLVAGP